MGPIMSAELDAVAAVIRRTSLAATAAERANLDQMVAALKQAAGWYGLDLCDPVVAGHALFGAMAHQILGIRAGLAEADVERDAVALVNLLGQAQAVLAQLAQGSK